MKNKISNFLLNIYIIHYLWMFYYLKTTIRYLKYKVKAPILPPSQAIKDLEALLKSKYR